MKRGKVITLEDLRKSNILYIGFILMIEQLKKIDRIILTDTEVQVYHNGWKVERYPREDTND